MANIKTLNKGEILALIEKYPSITYDADVDAIKIQSNKNVRYVERRKKIRLFFGTSNRSKVITFDVIKQAQRIKKHPVVVQQIHDMFDGSSLDDAFVTRRIVLEEYEENVKKVHKEKRA